MLEIDVFIGLNTQKGFEDQPKVIVNPDPAAAHSGDDIIWHIHSMDDQVQSVQVGFEDTGDGYFECRDQQPPSNKCHAHLHGKNGGGKGKHGHLLGTAPSLVDRSVKPSKYTILAFNGPDGKGEVLYKLDPTVVTCDP